METSSGLLVNSTSLEVGKLGASEITTNKTMAKQHDAVIAFRTRIFERSELFTDLQSRAKVLEDRADLRTFSSNAGLDDVPDLSLESVR